MARGASGGRAEPSVRVLKRLREELTEGAWPAGLTLLTGEDLYHLDQAQRALLQALVPPEASEFALTTYGDEKVDLATVVSACRSAGMFDPRRVVLVRELAALDGTPEALADYCENPPAGSHLIVRAPVLDMRRKLHKLLAGGGRRLVFQAPGEPDGAAGLSAVGAIATEKGVKLDRQATLFLAQVCAGDLYRVSTELDKTRAWLGDEGDRRVDLELIREVASGSGLLSGWEVANAITLKDAGAALGAARRLVESGEEPLRIIGGLAYRVRALLAAKAMTEAGAGFQEVVKATRSWPYKDDLRRGLGRYTREELVRFPSLLLDADRTLKSRGIPPGAVLEQLIRRMTATGDTTTERV